MRRTASLLPPIVDLNIADIDVYLETRSLTIHARKHDTEVAQIRKINHEGTPVDEAKLANNPLSILDRAATSLRNDSQAYLEQRNARRQPHRRQSWVDNTRVQSRTVKKVAALRRDQEMARRWEVLGSKWKARANSAFLDNRDLPLGEGHPARQVG
ncbi:hypothetical protein OQA88_3305 [Cercophora sp. LCS_1]